MPGSECPTGLTTDGYRHLGPQARTEIVTETILLPADDFQSRTSLEGGTLFGSLARYLKPLPSE